MKNPNELGTDSFPRVIQLDPDFRIVDLGHEIVMEGRSQDSLGTDRWTPASEQGGSGQVTINYRAWLVLMRALASASDAMILAPPRQLKLPSSLFARWPPEVVKRGSVKSRQRKQKASITPQLVSGGSR
jgi:hypothetical protein